MIKSIYVQTNLIILCRVNLFTLLITLLNPESKITENQTIYATLPHWGEFFLMGQPKDTG